MKYLYLIIVLIFTSCTQKSQITVSLNEVVLLKDSKHRKIERILTEAGTYFIEDKFEIIRYDLKQKQNEVSFPVLLLEGQKAKVYTTYRYAPIAEMIENLEVEFGLNYNQHIIIPELRVATQKQIETNNGFDGSALREIESGTFQSLENILSDKYIQLSYLRIDSITRN